MINHLARAIAKIQSLFRNSRVEEELAKEIATHLLYLEDEGGIFGAVAIAFLLR